MPLILQVPSTSASGDMLQFMSIPAALEAGPSQKSYEEVRIDDYLLAYRTTGKPPLPCPQEPVLAHERVTRGLPALFKPTLLPSSSSEVTEANANEALPEWQVFAVTKPPLGPGTSSTDRLQSITAADQYAAYSFEELRCRAYLAGRVVAPPPHILSSSTSSTLHSNGIQWGGDTTETFLSISSKPEFALHSFEELRLASMKANGRDVTSKELMGIGSSASGPSIAIPPFSSSPSTSSLFATSASPATPAAPSPNPPGLGASFSFSPGIRFK
ncbi:hypothetical protein EV361DRAFT_425584 [Lentinula raphanica]|nr:hypothetical protein F5880DRAFT_43425 [Lentinula raphanica]KAJ3975839.1 hypothetical protein EV361DRAFT_425584 [Lentinula raphanica]